MTPTLLILALAWLIFATLCAALSRNPREDALSGLALVLLRLYVLLFHRLRVEGREHIPPDPTINGRTVLIVANHTAGLDPLLIQSALRFFVRWMMAADMQGPPWLKPMWDFAEVILVQRHGATEVAGVREAVRALKGGHSVGVFPEGRLERVRGTIEPFLDGTGLLIARTRPIVVPVSIRGTPHCRSSWRSLLIPSHSRIRFHAPIDYHALRTKADQIAPDLEARFREWTR